MEHSATVVTTHGYSALGLKPGADLVLWRVADSPEMFQETIAKLLATWLIISRW